MEVRDTAPRVQELVRKRLSARVERARDEAAVAKLADILGVGPRVVSVDLAGGTLESEHGGQPLSRVRPCACVRWSDFAFWLHREARGRLNRLHDNGYLHLDVHADNWVMWPPACRRDVPEACAVAWRAAVRDTLRLVDYGSAVPLADGVYRGPTRGGRWNLMAPEQFSMDKGDVLLDASADHFALAAMIVDMSTGHAPFEVRGGRSMARFMDHPRRRDPALLSMWLRDAMWGLVCPAQLRSLEIILRCPLPSAKREARPGAAAASPKRARA